MKDILSSRLEAVKQRAKKSQLSGNLKFFYQKQR